MNCRKCHKNIPSDAVYCPYCRTKQVYDKTPRRRANGQGYAYKRGRTWTACVTSVIYDAEGVRKRKSKTKGGFATKKDALKYCDNLKHNNTIKRSLTYYWELYKQELDLLSTGKREAYEVAWRKMDSIKDADITTLTITDLRECVSQCKTYYPARDIKTILNKLYFMAGAEGYANAQLPSFINLPKMNSKEPDAFTPEEIGLIWEIYEGGTLFAGYILLMIYSGMMPGELRKLEISMIDFENKCILGAGLKTKARRTKPIVLADCIIPVLRALVNASEGSKIVYVAKQAFYRRYYNTLAKASVRPLNPYSCRHSTATALAADVNIAPATIARVMRHSENMIAHYIHPSDDDAKSAVNAIRVLYKDA